MPEPISKITAKQAWLRTLINEREKTLMRIGSGEISEFSSRENGIKAGRARRLVRRSLAKWELELAGLNDKVSKRRGPAVTAKQQLVELASMASTEDLSPAVLEHHERQFARQEAISRSKIPLKRLISLMEITSLDHLINRQELADLVGVSDQTLKELIVRAQTRLAEDGKTILTKSGSGGGYYQGNLPEPKAKYEPPPTPEPEPIPTNVIDALILVTQSAAQTEAPLTKSSLLQALDLTDGVEIDQASIIASLTDALIRVQQMDSDLTEREYDLKGNLSWLESQISNSFKHTISSPGLKRRLVEEVRERVRLVFVESELTAAVKRDKKVQTPPPAVFIAAT